jgi:hypothetical protein
MFPFAASAQQEHWDTYMSILGDKPASVLVDMALQPTAPNKLYPYLVITGPRTENCNAQKLPATEEIPLLEEMLDATSIFLSGVTAKTLAGTLTYNCERLNYYYVKDTMGIRSAINRLYERSYKNHHYTVKIKHEPEWKTYRTFLYPDEQTQLWMENNRKISEMRQAGDSLTKERNINFTLYLPSEATRDSIMLFASKEQLTSAKLPMSMSGSLYGIILSKYGPVKMDIINTLSAKIIAEAKKYKGYYYKGWSADIK